MYFIDVQIMLVSFFNMQLMRIPYAMSPMKNPKRPFYDFKMKIMMYLDYSFWKFPFPTLGEGGKGRSKLSHCIDKPKFLPFIHLSLLSSVVARSVTTRKVKGSNPAGAYLFFLDGRDVSKFFITSRLEVRFWWFLRF